MQCPKIWKKVQVNICLRAEINIFWYISFFKWSKEETLKNIHFNSSCCIISPLFRALCLTISPKLTHPPPTPLSANKACHFSALLRVKKNLNHGFIWGSWKIGKSTRPFIRQRSSKQSERGQENLESWKWHWWCISRYFHMNSVHI